jgi:hypothetical protein
MLRPYAVITEAATEGLNAYYFLFIFAGSFVIYPPCKLKILRSKIL